MSSPSEPHSAVTDLINTGIAEMPHESVWKKFVMHPGLLNERKGRQSGLTRQIATQAQFKFLPQPKIPI